MRQHKDPCLLVLVIEQLLYFRKVVHFSTRRELKKSGFSTSSDTICSEGSPQVDTSIRVHCTAIRNQSAWVQHMSKQVSSPQILSGAKSLTSICDSLTWFFEFVQRHFVQGSGGIRIVVTSVAHSPCG